MAEQTPPGRRDAGIHAELRVGDPGTCPVAAASASVDAPISSVDRSTPDGGGLITEDFTVSGGVEVDDPELTEVFRTDAGRRYRFTRTGPADCVCDTVEQFALPVANIRAENGALVLTFHAPDLETIKGIVRTLREEFDDVGIRQLTRSGEGSEEGLVLVDRTRLTDRQLEVLETAHGMGYFEHPKRANASDVADELGIALSTFSEHLSAAQSKVLDGVLQV